MIKILFICHGNICRSPMGEYILKDLAARRGRSEEFEIDSAAVSREEIGNPVYPPARRELKKRGVTCAGLLATNGTIQTGVYQKHFGSIRLLTPEGEDQAAVMDMIYGGVKAGVMDYDASRVQAAAERLLAQGAQTIILGCTELPLALELYHLNFPATDPTLELAKGAIRFAGGKVKGEA